LSYQSSNNRKSGAISGSEADPMAWDLTSEQGRAVMVLTVTTDANCTLKIQEAPSAAELASPTLDLPHVSSVAVTANTTKRVIVGLDPSLPVGKAWVESGSGNYVLDGGRRAHS